MKRIYKHITMVLLGAASSVLKTVSEASEKLKCPTAFLSRSGILYKSV